MGEITQLGITLTDEELRPQSLGGKLFASLCGVWCLAVFASVVGVVAGPILQPIIAAFSLEPDEGEHLGELNPALQLIFHDEIAMQQYCCRTVTHLIDKLDGVEATLDALEVQAAALSIQQPPAKPSPSSYESLAQQSTAESTPEPTAAPTTEPNM
jgi:hypothetical protein